MPKKGVTLLGTRLWFKSKLELDELCVALEAALALAPFSYDAENIYEWGEAESIDGSWKINVSRKHEWGLSLPNEPYHIGFRGNAPAAADVAKVIAAIAQAEVCWGEIRYIGGDDYEYYLAGSCKQ